MQNLITKQQELFLLKNAKKKVHISIQQTTAVFE